MVALIGVVLGFALLAVGLLGVTKPYEMAALEETIDAIGSKRPGSVEPANWKVRLTRGTSACVALFGAVVLVLAAID